VRKVDDNLELIVTSESGMVIRMPISDIREIGRATQGVRIMRIREDDRVITVAKVMKSEEEAQVLEAAEAESDTGEKKKVSDADFVGLKEENGNGNGETE
jgi:DNA gyrase subunit A